MTREVQKNATVIDQFPAFDFDGYSKKTGLTTFTATVWKDGVSQANPVTITEITATPGEYKLEFVPDDNGYWKVEVLIDYNKDVYGFFYVVVPGTIEEIYSLVQRIAGLSHENIFIDNTEYDVNGQLIEARVRLFDSKANCDAATDGGSETTGLIATYTLTTLWQAANQFAVFKQVLEP